MLITLDLTEQEIEKLTDVLTEHWDKGPSHSGWQSGELIVLTNKVHHAIERSSK